jgi:hypothetical protein
MRKALTDALGIDHNSTDAQIHAAALQISNELDATKKELEQMEIWLKRSEHNAWDALAHIAYLRLPRYVKIWRKLKEASDA